MEKNKPTGRSVLLFSGGCDSLILDYLLKPDILLYLPHGNKYEERESVAIMQLENRNLLHGRLITQPVFQFKEFEREDGIIPSRNLFFLTFASLYGEKLYLASVYGDRTLDKSKEFFDRCRDMFNYLYQEQHWCEGREFQVLAPYKEYTKTELVREYLEKGGNEEALFLSYSCYEGKDKPCMTCKACVRKMVALINNDIQVPSSFSFSKVPWLQKGTEIREQLDSGLEQWRGREDKDFIRAMIKTGYC